MCERYRFKNTVDNSQLIVIFHLDMALLDSRANRGVVLEFFSGRVYGNTVPDGSGRTKFINQEQIMINLAVIKWWRPEAEGS